MENQKFIRFILLSQDTSHNIHKIMFRFINKTSDPQQCNHELLDELKKAKEIYVWSKSKQRYLPSLDIVDVDLERGLIEIKVWSGIACHYKIQDLAPIKLFYL